MIWATHMTTGARELIEAGGGRIEAFPEIIAYHVQMPTGVPASCIHAGTVLCFALSSGMHVHLEDGFFYHHKLRSDPGVAKACQQGTFTPTRSIREEERINGINE